MNFTENSISESFEIANAFNHHFKSVFKDNKSPHSVPPASADPPIFPENKYSLKAKLNQWS